MSNDENDENRPEADEDTDDGATPAEFIDRPENLPGDPGETDDNGRRTDDQQRH